MVAASLSKQEKVCQTVYDDRSNSILPCKNNSPNTKNRINACSKSDSFEYSNPNINEINHSAKKTEHKPFFSRILNSIRTIWKQIRVLNPLTIFFCYLERIRCAKHIEAAKGRNNAKSKEDLTQYHRSLLFNESNPDDKALFKMHISKEQSPKPLIVLFLGNCQTHNWSEESAGLLKLFNKVKAENDSDILVFRVGNASDELLHRFCMSSDCSLHPDVIYEHTKNIIEDRINGKGIFEDQTKPEKVIMCGYSWGGGSIDKLLRKDWHRISSNVPVAGTAYIDAIKLGSFDLGCPVEERPPFSGNHINFYQQNSTFLNGSNINLHPKADKSEEISVNDINHNNIDDYSLVIENTYSFIRKISP